MERDLIESVKASHKGKVFAFVANPNLHFPGKPPFMLGVAVLGASGFEPLNLFYDTYDTACAFAENLNGLLGYDDDTAVSIVADTMNRSGMKRDAAEGLTTVKLDAAQIEELLSLAHEARDFDGRLFDMLEEAAEDLRTAAPAAF